MNELKFPDEDLNSLVPVFASDSAIIKEGWLWKQGKDEGAMNVGSRENV